MYKCIIIDDQQRSVDNLVNYIERYSGLEVIQKFSHPLVALEEINRMEKVDVIFMDVDMPALTGIELAKIVRDKTEALIFTTAYSKYAFDAYELRAEAYLLKPFGFAKFVEEVNRVLSPEIASRATEERNSTFFLVKKKEEGNIIKINFEDVTVFESFSNYMKIYTSSSKEPVVAYLTLKDVLSMLEKRNINFFLQIHRAFIISLMHIESIQGNMIRMKDRDLQIGGHYKNSVKSLIEKDLVTTNRRLQK